MEDTKGTWEQLPEADRLIMEKFCNKCDNVARKITRGTKIVYDSVCTPCYEASLLDAHLDWKHKRQEKAKLTDDKVKSLRNVTCEKCKENFISNTKSKYCQNPCKSPWQERQAMSESDKWINAKPKKGNGMDSDQVAYAFFRKQYSVKSKYRVCRG